MTKWIEVNLTADSLITVLKVCTDCYHEAAECKEFADKCSRAFAKLKNAKIADHMILGKSAKEMKLVKGLKLDAEPPKKKSLGSSSDFTLDRRPRLLPSPKAGAPPAAAAARLQARNNGVRGSLAAKRNQRKAAAAIADADLSPSDDDDDDDYSTSVNHR